MANEGEVPNIYKLIREKRKKYDLTKNIYCPFLQEVIYFNNKGFFHATHTGRGRSRSESDSRMRLYLLDDVNEVISRCSSFGNPPRVVSKNHPNNSTGKEIIFYELIYRFNKNKEVVVIIRRIGNGRLHYYSVRFAKKQNRPKGSA